MKQIFMYTGRFGKGQTLTMLEMKNGKRRFTLKYKLLFALAVVLFALLCFGCCEVANAADITDYHANRDYVGYYETACEYMTSKYGADFVANRPYRVVVGGWAEQNIYCTVFFSEIPMDFGNLSVWHEAFFPATYCVYVYYDTDKVEYSNRDSVYCDALSIRYTTYDIYYGDGLVIESSKENSDVSFTSLDVPIAGTNYTVSEPLPYYFVYYSDDYVSVVFSDIPLVCSRLDLYARQLETVNDCKVVSYYWDSTEQNDFLSSRTVHSSDDVFTLKLGSDFDYMCNYTVTYRHNLLSVCFPEKNALDAPDYTAAFLYSSLPEELRERNYIIIFRQDSPCAYDDRILFYGWDDVNANLYINSFNSQISAIKGRSAVMDVSKAYYDETLSEWVVSDNVVLGATTDGSYHLPHIYFCDSDLFVADPEWYGTGTVAYMADLERPLLAFDEPVEDEEEGLLGSILNGFKKLFISLFVPSSGYFEKRVDEISSRFGFWTSIRDTANVFIDFLKETDFNEPPTVEIDLSLIKSKVNYGGKAYAFDMRWYEPYKESVDVIISSIMWLVFVWNTYKNLPNIISGVSSGLPATSSLLDERKE